MHIEFEFSGGYGGLFAAKPLGYRVETDELPDEVRDKLLALIRDSGVLELKPAQATGGPGPQRDVFTYSLTIGEGAAAKSFAFDDASAPPAVRPLLSRLRELAVEQRMRP
ncbi:MAG: hypothetical protein OEU09_21270 [Rhodospirillales bacterium]|nr:hypothetical protein [Rhodospirillales bacterium]MDH3913818.1 hypothetical protein [Rhodospirillales bacterium]MDH3968227.1 hypothetical protein [Rhodospirillales bacterium]